MGARQQCVGDCFDCGNTGMITTSAASVTIELPCPACERSDWHAAVVRGYLGVSR